MENFFTSKMAVKTTAELKNKVANRKDYSDEAVLASLWELKKRDELSKEEKELLRQIEERSLKQRAEKSEKVEQEARDFKETVKFWVDFFLLKQQVKVVTGVFYICVVVYTLMLIFGVNPINPSPYYLLDWGGNLTQLSFGPQPWRLVTHIFLHGSIVHMLMNMIILLYIGPIVELMIGKRWFFIVFLVTGISGGITSAAWNTNVVSVGASGAIFGLYGLTLCLLLMSRDKSLKRNFTYGIVLFLGYNLLFGLTSTGVDNAAHFGGLGTGFLFGLILGLGKFKNKSLPESQMLTRFRVTVKK